MFRKVFYVISMFLFMICLNGCKNNEKIKIDMSNVKWEYNDDFEYNGSSYEVELVNLPKEVSVSYGGDTSARDPGNYTATVTFSYDAEKYELVNNKIQGEFNWKIWDVFYVRGAESSASSNHHTSLFDGRVTRSLINYIHFVNYITTDTSKVTESTPYLWYENENGETHVYIGFDATKYKNIKLPANSSYYFAYMHNLEGITGLEYVDTSNVTDMKYMFYSTGYNSSNFTLDLNSFNTKNVTNMESMFEHTAQYNVNFTLNLGDNFDTSNVTNMKSMFEECGYHSNVLVLDLKDKFNTSNVTTMERMFWNAGWHSEAMYIDLGNNFDVSKVTKFDRMFANIVSSTNQNNWNLSIKGTVKSNATTANMFANFAPNVNKTIYVDNITSKNILDTKIGETTNITVIVR